MPSKFTHTSVRQPSKYSLHPFGPCTLFSPLAGNRVTGLCRCHRQCDQPTDAQLRASRRSQDGASQSRLCPLCQFCGISKDSFIAAIKLCGALYRWDGTASPHAVRSAQTSEADGCCPCGAASPFTRCFQHGDSMPGNVCHAQPACTKPLIVLEQASNLKSGADVTAIAREHLQCRATQRYTHHVSHSLPREGGVVNNAVRACRTQGGQATASKHCRSLSEGAARAKDRLPLAARPR